MKKQLQLLFILLFCFEVNAQNVPCFRDTTTMSADLVISGVEMITYDFNKDGKSDLAWITPNVSSSVVTVALGKGDGTFTKKNYSTGSADGYDIAVGFFNQDNLADIAVSNPTAHNISVLLNAGSGTFQAGQQASTGAKYPGKLVAGEIVSGSGSELVFADYPGTGLTVTVLKNTNYGTYSSGGSFTTTNTVTDLLYAQVPGTGSSPDIIAARDANSGSNLILANGDGTGLFTKNDLTVDGKPTGIFAADVNGDFRADIITANSTAKTVSVLLASATGFTTASVKYDVGFSPTAVTVKDFTGDGKPDIATCNGLDDNVSILPGDGTGVFGAAVHFPVPDNPLAIGAGDFNLDGSADIAVACYGVNKIAFLFNQRGNITSVGALQFCEGGSVQLKSNKTGGSYLWSPGGGTVDSLVATVSGSYSVTITNTAKTCSTTSNSITVTVLPKPALAVNDTTICKGTSVKLTATGANTYTWSTSATGASITVSPNITSDYIVTGTGANSCEWKDTATVKVVTCDPTSVDDIEAESLKIYPNPACGKTSISFPMKDESEMTLRITNTQGQLVFEENRTCFSGQYKSDVDLSKYTDGMYFLNVITNRQVVTQRIVVVR